MRRMIAATALSVLMGVSPSFAQDAGFDAGTVLATVDGTDITLGHVIALRQRLSQQAQGMPDEQLFRMLLDQLIDQTLLANTVSGTEADDPLAVRVAIENERRAALASLGIQNSVPETVDDAAIQAEYDEAFSEFESQPEFNASHILVPDEETAKSLLAEIEAGADFAETARENSTGPSGPNGGSLGWFGLGAMVPAFEEAVTGMEAGEVTGPVQTQFGWHLIKLNETRQSAPPPLEEVRQQIETNMRREQLQDLVLGLREEAEIDLKSTAIPFDAINSPELLTE